MEIFFRRRDAETLRKTREDQFYSSLRLCVSASKDRLTMSTVFIISAPSGSGKSTLVARLMTEVRDLMFSISYTTRKPRGSEKNGQSYRFVSREEFEAHGRARRVS